MAQRRAKRRDFGRRGRGDRLKVRFGAKTMSTYTATIRWRRNPSERFTDGQYSRAHSWAFDGGAVVPASSSPGVVRVPFSDPAAVDPEEALVASLSSRSEER